MEEDLSQLDRHTVLVRFARKVVDHSKSGSHEDYSVSLDYMFEIIERIDRLTKENEQLKEEVEGWRKEFMF
jgi:hypothetical protein